MFTDRRNHRSPLRRGTAVRAEGDDVNRVALGQCGVERLLSADQAHLELLERGGSFVRLEANQHGREHLSRTGLWLRLPCPRTGRGATG